MARRRRSAEQVSPLGLLIEQRQAEAELHQRIAAADEVERTALWAEMFALRVEYRRRRETASDAGGGAA